MIPDKNLYLYKGIKSLEMAILWVNIEQLFMQLNYIYKIMTSLKE